MLTLYGSLPSPYVRRIRILLDGKDFEFVPMNIFEEKQRAFLISKNPTLKIPMLEDDGKFIFDSNTIYRYLQEKFGFEVVVVPLPTPTLESIEAHIMENKDDTIAK